jgi:hypothetical protein
MVLKIVFNDIPFFLGDGNLTLVSYMGGCLKSLTIAPYSPFMNASHDVMCCYVLGYIGGWRSSCIYEYVVLHH